MMSRIISAWTWFIGGLVDAVLWLIDRSAPRASYRVEIDTGPAKVHAPDGAEIGRIEEAGAQDRFGPPQLVGRLAGAAIDLSIPPAWLFRRRLDPVARESVPFLDGFVRHQIERITPWRAADVHYRIVQSPLPGDASRVAIEIGVVPKRLLDPWVGALAPLRPLWLRVGPHGSKAGGDFAILLGGAATQRVHQTRRAVLAALSAMAVLYVGGLAWLWWQAAEVRDGIEAQDRVAEERKAVLARAQRRDTSGQNIDAKLRDLRKAQLRAVDVVDALSRALPDSAHLTDFDLQKDHLTLSGISTDTSVLVPALETSGRFADVAFGAATTKVEAGAGDRFHLDMRVLGRTGTP